MGFNPSPLTLPVIAAREILSGAIQVIQLKYESAWKMKLQGETQSAKRGKAGERRNALGEPKVHEHGAEAVHKPAHLKVTEPKINAPQKHHSPWKAAIHWQRFPSRRGMLCSRR
jgi:hypothetical protein